MYYTSSYLSPLGPVLLASDGDNIIGAWFEGQKYYCGTMEGEAALRDDLPVFAIAKDWLDRYFKGDKPAVSEVPLAPLGGAFRQEVWKVLRQIPYGESITYSEIAKAVAARQGKDHMSAQAVGGAVGHNPISIIVPCHRVIGSNGSLTGYAAGIDKKIRLLEHEGVDMTGLFVPTQGTAL